MEADDQIQAVVEQVVQRCQRAGLSRPDAEDCVQDALLALLTRRADPEAEPIAALQAWLTVVAHRKMLDRLRSADREQQALARLHARTPSVLDDPGELVADRALADWLTRELRELPAMTRLVCQSIAEGADVTATASRLGLTRRAVQSHLTRARRLLRVLAAGAAATLAGTALKLLRPAAAAAAPVAVAVVTTGVTLLPHHGPLPDPGAQPHQSLHAPAAIHTPAPAWHPDTASAAIPATAVLSPHLDGTDPRPQDTEPGRNAGHTAVDRPDVLDTTPISDPVPTLVPPHGGPVARDRHPDRCFRDRHARLPDGTAGPGALGITEPVRPSPGTSTRPTRPTRSGPSARPRPHERDAARGDARTGRTLSPTRLHSEITRQPPDQP